MKHNWQIQRSKWSKQVARKAINPTQPNRQALRSNFCKCSQITQINSKPNCCYPGSHLQTKLLCSSERVALKGKTREASGQEAERPDEGNYKENVDIKAEFEVFIITNVCQPSWWIKNNMESGNIALPHLAISEPCLKKSKIAILIGIFWSKINSTALS